EAHHGGRRHALRGLDGRRRDLQGDLPAAAARITCGGGRRRLTMPVTWSDAADEIITGDLTTAVAYVTPAGGAVVTAVAPIGLRDRDAGTVGFTTSLGFGRKLDRIKANPRVALAYHAREHGFATGSRFVLIQGIATYDA